ncbi:MAG TPA: hypothetical protein VHF06_15110 [Pseudonocardiaceae bacterium]|nr:hypothetical protein [Pseudonocardiaceae bacterium]
MPALTQDDADRELTRLTTDGDRIAEALVALENHPGYRFLQGAALSGRTMSLWATAKTDVALLYQRFGLYRSILAKAQEIRTRRHRLNPADLAELATLLRGSAVELGTEEIPLGQRNLTGPSTITHRMTLAELVDDMDTAFQRATDIAVATDEVWSAVVRVLDPMDTQLDRARETAASLGLGEIRDPLFIEVDDIGDALADLRSLAFGDPLGLYRGEPGSGRPDLADVERLAHRLTAVRGKLDDLAAVRSGYDDRVARASAAIDAVAAAEADARAAYDLVLEKIAAPAIAPVPNGTGPLRDRLAGLTPLVAKHDWGLVADELAVLAAETDRARERAADVQDTATALLDRRSELRGRLDAYRVKAARLRLSEDAELAVRYQEAYDLLWTIPCDLRAATKALNRYQQAITAKGATA